MLSWETTYCEERSAACPNTPKVIRLRGCAGGGQDAWKRARRQKAQKRCWPGARGIQGCRSLHDWWAVWPYGGGPLLPRIPSLCLKLSPLNSDPVGLPQKNIILKEPPQKENYTFSALSIPSSYNPDNQDLRTFEHRELRLPTPAAPGVCHRRRVGGRQTFVWRFLAKTPRLWLCRAFPTTMGALGCAYHLPPGPLTYPPQVGTAICQPMEKMRAWKEAGSMGCHAHCLAQKRCPGNWMCSPEVGNKGHVSQQARISCQAANG